MSDERPEMTPQELDELASAYLDGETTAEEAALVESDPRLQAVVEELRSVRDLVAAPVDLPADEVRDQMIAQALDHRAPVVSLETARRRLRSVPPQARVVLAAAAVVAVLAMVGVTLFEQANRDNDDMLADDAASAPSMADEPALEMAESAPAPDSAQLDEESLPSSGAADDAADAAVEAPAAEMVESEMAMTLEEAPMDDGEASDQPAAGEAELAMADEPADVVPTAGDALREFAAEADLFDHVEDLVAEPAAEGPEEAADSVDLMGCPQPSDEELKLVIRFAAVVGGVEVVVSVYGGNGEQLISQTTPPPECSLVKPLTPLP